MKKKINFGIIIFILVLLVLSYFVYNNYKKKYKNNVSVETYLFIPTGSNFDDVKKRIKNKVINYDTFLEIAEKNNYKDQIKPGKYKLYIGEDNQEIIDKLINGKQEEVILNINSFDNISQIVEILRQNIEADSTKIYTAFNNQKQKDNLTDLDLLKIYFIPDKYTILWNDQPEKIIQKFKNNYNNFWNQTRKNQAYKLGFNQLQIINFAAITQRESNRKDEQPRIAGLYINRFKKGMKLQSDPTVLFAKKKIEGFDKKYYRVYFRDLSIDSPYNTYKYLGLPPVPICSPNKESIDAVLNAEKHDYIYMCASPIKIGYHDFTVSYIEHEKNAQKYRAYLNQRNIK